MSVSILWKYNDQNISDSFDCGSIPYASYTQEYKISLSHNAINNITNCKFYISLFNGIYSGARSSSLDMEELLLWGNGLTSLSFGGFQINMNNVNNFPTLDWPTYSLKFDARFSSFYTGRGDSSANGILLSSMMHADMLSDGILPPEIEASFKCRIQIPETTNHTGIRQFGQKLVYTYTS